MFVAEEIRLSRAFQFHEVIVECDEGVIGWHATRKLFLPLIMSKGLKRGAIELFFHDVPLTYKPVMIYTGPFGGKYLPRDAWLEVDLSKVKVKVLKYEKRPVEFRVHETIQPHRIKVLTIGEAIARATKPEWVPWGLSFRLEEFHPDLSLPYLRRMKRVEFRIGPLVNREPRILETMTFEEAKVRGNPNMKFFVKLWESLASP
jgi:hypothetical protein